jgi:hypothetical protein
MTRAQLRTCLGAPTKGGAGAARWSYGRGLTVTFRAGRVSAFSLLDGRFATSRTGAGVGSTLRVLQRDVPALRREPRTGRRRTLVVREDGRYADISVQVGRRGRVARITATLRTRAQLDAFGRSLERRVR